MADILAAAAITGQPDQPERKRRKIGSLPTASLEHMRTETLHYASANGLLLGAEGPFMHAPCSLLPYPFPEALFYQAESLAQPFNTLVDRVSRDTDWLCQTVRKVVGHDEFTRRLLELCEAVIEEGVVQPLQLGIYRSDYMVDQPTEDAAPRLLQVACHTSHVPCEWVTSRLNLALTPSGRAQHSGGVLCIAFRQSFADAPPQRTEVGIANRSHCAPFPNQAASSGGRSC